MKGDTVVVHYKGTFVSGKKFDSSYTRGDPLTFTIGEGQVIKCWEDAIKGRMKGFKADLVCPAKLAYGPKGRGSVPPDSALLFSIEILDVTFAEKRETDDLS